MYSLRCSVCVCNVCVCVLAEPPVLLHKSANLDRLINSVSRFTCLFDGWPAPDVTWMHNGYPIAATTGAAAGGERHRLMQGGTELLVQQSQVLYAVLDLCGRKKNRAAQGTPRRRFANSTHFFLTSSPPTYCKGPFHPTTGDGFCSHRNS